MQSKIEGFERVVQAVGFETSFHDGEVLSLELDRMREAPSLTICILTRRSLWPGEKAPTDPLYYLVRMRFDGLDNLEMDGFNYQNVISTVVETEIDGRLKIWFAGIFGVDCSFTCQGGHVLSVEETELPLGKPERLKNGSLAPPMDSGHYAESTEQMEGLPNIPGTAEVVAWFGRWPSFHDAEVLSITLDRSQPSRVVIHTWNRTQELDAKGYYILDRHAIVTFVMEGFLLDHAGFTNTRIDNFNLQNVLSGATVNKTVAGYDLILDGIYGVSALISVEHLRVELAPGSPEPSIYRVL